MYYFVGIKGTGMAALACILFDAGYEVCGSDLPKHFFTEDELVKRKIKIFDFNPDNIKDGYTVIIGNAFLDDFPEAKAALENKSCEVYRYHTFVGKLLEDYHSIGIAGSHGKTTTTTLVSTMLNDYFNIGYLIGDGTGHIDQDASDFVIEADEYCRHFLAYKPDFTVITNIDWDHVDYFKTLDDYILSYQQLINQTKKAVIMCSDDPYTKKMVASCAKYYYGTNQEDDFYAYNIVEDCKGVSFDLNVLNKYFGHFDLPFIGHHLLLDSLAAIAVGYLKGLDAKQIESSLLKFKGAKRRFVVDENGENIYIDDYAHHPTEIKATLLAAKMKYPNRKVVAIFKPHRASRVQYFVNEFVDALSVADEIGVCEFTSIDDHIDGCDINISYLAEKIKGCYVFHETEEDAQLLNEFGPAVYVFMSSKDIYPFKDKLKNIQS